MRLIPAARSRGRRTHSALIPVLIALAVAIPLAAGAQHPSTSDARGAFASRATLEQRALDAERAAQDASLQPVERESHRGDAWLLRNRLTEGDFLVGDRIVITVAGEAALSDTFTVRAGPAIQLGTLPPVSLRGVLRSELEDHVRTELRRYLREPNITVVPLLRVAVMGKVVRPGFYHVPADVLLSDVLMVAGGPGADADLKRSIIRRGEDALYAAGDFSVALSDGISLDVLGLRSGDVVVLEERRRRDWSSILQVVGVVTSVLAIVVGLGS